jgi:hypothetical protein
MDQILEVINRYAPHNREITNKTYASKVYKLVSAGIDLDDFSSTSEFIMNNYTKKTYKSIITSVIVYRKAIGASTEEYDTELKKVNDEIQRDYEKNEASPSESQNFITRREIKGLIDFYKAKLELTAPFENNTRYFDRFQQYLVLNLYYLIPPVRNDFVNLQVHATYVPKKSQDEETNYIFLNKKQLVLNRYKTKKTYGASNTMDLPGELVDIVREWLNVREIIYPELVSQSQLLLTKTLVPMKQVNLTQYLNRIFGRKISSTMLRKSYLSEKYPVVHSKEEMKNDAKAMLHSVDTQQTIYRKSR